MEEENFRMLPAWIAGSCPVTYAVFSPSVNGLILESNTALTNGCAAGAVRRSEKTEKVLVFLKITSGGDLRSGMEEHPERGFELTTFRQAEKSVTSCGHLSS